MMEHSPKILASEEKATITTTATTATVFLTLIIVVLVWFSVKHPPL